MQLTGPVPSRNDMRMALVVTRRELRDSFRDWRIIIPIVALTLIFPALMNFAAERIMAFLLEFDSEVIGDRLIPFLLMIVGFFPTSFSLVIALETFVGEKERKSLEPLLATPLTNTQLYLGKMLAALIPPLAASYLGVTVYSLGILFTIGWSISFSLFLLIMTLTTVQAVVMVAGAVVVSSQTTSVRAANLLASFIIVPMALLIQFEAAMMFWGNRAGLWWLVLALVLVLIVFVRMGIRLFNREELLGRDIDQIRIGWALRLFWGRFSGRTAVPQAQPGLAGWYRSLFRLMTHLRQPALVTMLALFGGLALGYYFAHVYPLPKEFAEVITSTRPDSGDLARLQIIASRLPFTIFVQNSRALLIAAILGVFTLGTATIGIFMLPWLLIGYVAGQITLFGGSNLGFLVMALLPHGLVEIPALLLATAASLRWHTVFVAPPPRVTVSESWLLAAADFARIFVGLVLPLLLLAALVEAYVTPWLLGLVYG